MLEQIPGIKIMIVGRSPPEHLLGKIDYFPKQDGKLDFLNKLKDTKILMITSVSDASPRILTQALFANTSVIVNTNIVGGWKYANP